MPYMNFEFFADQLSKGKAYNTIVGYRSAISEIHEKIVGYSINQHPTISKAIFAVKKINPPKIPSDEPIDIQPLLDYISEMEDNNSISLRDLSIKMAFLVSLITTSRL